MSKQPAENTDDFLHHLDAIVSRSAHHEQLQARLLHFILDSANKAVTTHCESQQANLRDLFRDPNLNQIDQENIEQVNDDFAAAGQLFAKSLPEVDDAFNGARIVNNNAEEMLSGLTTKLANEKLATAINAANKEFENKYKAVATNTLLIIGGLLLCGLTFGLGAAEGAGLIVEGVKGLREGVASQHDDSVVLPAVENNLLNEFDKIDNRNRELFNESWLQLIERHCHAQQQSIQAMKNALPPDHHHYDSLITLENTYDKNIKQIDKIKKENSDEKLEAIKTLAFAIQNTEKRAKICIQNIKSDLPEPVKPEADGFLDRAERFYQNNKKMIQFAGLMAMTAVGVALTIATGGIAAAIGAAVLGAVAFKSTKSAGGQATHFLSDCFSGKKVEKLSPEDKKKLIVVLRNHAIEHCDKQIKLLDKLDVPTIPSFSKYASYKDQLKSENTIDGVKAISLQIEQVDKFKARDIKNTTIEKQFKQNANAFKKENKEMFSAVAKVVLAAAALTVLGIATGGVGVGIALGCAAASWFVGKVIKKARDYKSTASKGSEHTSEKPPVIH